MLPYTHSFHNSILHKSISVTNSAMSVLKLWLQWLLPTFCLGTLAPLSCAQRSSEGIGCPNLSSFFSNRNVHCNSRKSTTSTTLVGKLNNIVTRSRRSTRGPLALNCRNEKSKHNLERPDQNRISQPMLRNRLLSHLHPHRRTPSFSNKGGKENRVVRRMSWWNDGERFMTWIPRTRMRKGRLPGRKTLLLSRPNRENDTLWQQAGRGTLS
jgi:hypothetical protein